MKKIENLKFIGWLLITIIVITFFSYPYDRSKEVKENQCVTDYYNELELKYWHSKSELIDEVQKYIDTNSKESDLSAIVLVNACEEYKVDIRFVLAQGLLESHFGTKGLATKTNSVWNVFDSKVYKHPDQSVRPYLKLLTERYLVNKIEVDLLENFVDVNEKRYAEYPKYEQELKIKLKEMKNTKIDSLLNVMTKQKLRLNR